MRRLLLTLILLCCSASPVYSIDFVIKDATPSSTLIPISVELTGATSTNCPDSVCYLLAALKQDAGNYFGETENNQGEWIAYSSKPEKDFIKSSYYSITLVGGEWKGIINLRFDPADSNYHGPGSYTLSLFRYTGNSQSPTSNSPTLSVELAEPLPVPSPTPTPASSPTPTPTPSTSPNPSPTPSPTPTPKPSIKPSPSPDLELKTGTIAGQSTEIDLSEFGLSPSPSISPDNQENLDNKLTLNRSRAKIILLIGSGLLLISLVGFIGYRRYLASHSQE